MEELNAEEAEQVEQTGTDGQVDEAEPTEAEQGRKPYTPGQKAIVVLLLLLIAGAVGSATLTVSKDWSREPQPPELVGDPMCSGPAAGLASVPDPVGSLEARIKIEACLGHCIGGEMQRIAAVAAAWPDQIRAEFYSYESTEGQQFVSDHDESLACIFVNGENSFTITKDGEETGIAFSGPPGGSYQVDDLAPVLKAKFQEVYGAVPADFDTKVRPLHEEMASSCGAGSCGGSACSSGTQ